MRIFYWPQNNAVVISLSHLSLSLYPPSLSLPSLSLPLSLISPSLSHLSLSLCPPSLSLSSLPLSSLPLSLPSLPPATNGSLEQDGGVRQPRPALLPPPTHHHSCHVHELLLACLPHGTLEWFWLKLPRSEPASWIHGRRAHGMITIHSHIIIYSIINYTDIIKLPSVFVQLILSQVLCVCVV